VSQLNYHHLNYFRVVARTGNLTRAAQQLNVSQSAVSTQIRQLEEQLGQALFERQGRRLAITESGRIALSYAETIHASGSELLSLFRQGVLQIRQVLRIGAVATLSRNFQESFVEPLLGRVDVTLIIQSGNLSELLPRLATHNLDLVLSNKQMYADVSHPWRCRRIARQQVSLVGQPRPLSAKPFRFPEDLQNLNLILPSQESELRGAFDLLCEQHQLRITTLAEVDDMAMVRVLARASASPAVIPTVVVRDELRNGVLEEYCRLPGLYENFYAINVRRQFEHPLIPALFERSDSDLLEI
jgi:LysR family transcriptional activator of nhaA